MKIECYVDVYAWTKPEDVCVFNSSTVGNMTKAEGCKRYRVQFEVPDLLGVDATVPATAVEEVKAA